MIKSRFTGKKPALTVDVIVEYKNGIILIERKNPPYGWALPGGFVDYGETVETAARREIKEEISLKLAQLKQFKVYSDPSRDPRGHTVSVVFTAKGKGPIIPGSDALKAKILPVLSHQKQLKLQQNIVFDHRRILKDYFKSRKEGNV